MIDQPNKPDGEAEGKDATDVDDRQAIDNQSQVTPDDYPADDGGRPDYGSPKR